MLTKPGILSQQAEPLLSAEASPNASALANIQAVIDGDGQIMVGTVAPIRGAAMAHDGRKTRVMLRRRPEVAMLDLHGRLDAAIATTQSPGSSIAEINTTASNGHYEI